MDYTLIFIILGFLIVFPLFFGGIVWMIAIISGWERLGKYYKSEKPRKEIFGQSLRINHMNVGWMKYSNVISIIGTEEGLHISQMFPFGLIHQPLLIPWGEFKKIEEKNRLIGRMVRLSIGHPEVGYFEMSSKNYQQLVPYLTDSK